MAGSSGPAQPGGSGNGRKSTEIKVKLPPDMAGGVYANAMLVQHTDEEFIMDFTVVVGRRGTVVSRVIASPSHMKRMMAALQENMRRYEAAHGVVKGPEGQPKMRLGFQPSEE